MKISLALAGVVLLGTSLTACGGSDGGGGGSEDAYCKELKSAQKSFASVSQSDFSALDSAIQTFHKLAKDAPSDVKTDWKTLDGAFVKIEDAFASAGIKMSDLEDIQAGKIPEGADVSKLSSLATSFGDISSAKVKSAQTAITKHAKDVCKVTLGS